VQQMASTGRRRPRLKDLPGGQVTELIVIVATALIIALAVQWLLIKPYRIPSGSMEPTLDVGQRVLVNRLTHRLGSDPGVGDVITFHPPAGADELPARRARARRPRSPARRSSSASSASAGTASRSATGA
jgi:signal peptidase I